MTRLVVFGVLLAVGLLLWRRLASRASVRARPEETVILRLRVADTFDSQDEIRDRLEAVDRSLRRALRGVGEVEPPVAEGEICVYHLYGANAEAMAEAAREGLAGTSLRPGSTVTLRRGGMGAPEREDTLVGD